ncbi:MAG: HigA family addiction module antidote protein [Rhodocyclaceae bacterium]|jgi:addiction module HigA family antidote|nr:HigA family addiction module antidote protein [Rhodocyclaceae bacterium]MBK6552920.1 HigA family addiction module antidote protein [Rhodocyclaceae bacterium]MBK6676403.1 HigA family addiction module antidote protein [Rhodocyclaceae bacterium]MBK9312455.1 HigA family addiction module antidote protein [Rhodocyclaceae bacterium]MBK9955867.1 HigA family addiction module antidote protein [Rhodocyclaceae bacterium]
MSRMHNPPHPGAVLREWLPEEMTVTDAAASLKVARVTLSKILNGNAGISADMALRLSQWLGTSPDVWMGMQTQFDLWQAGKQKRPAIAPMRKAA